jgi:hypothetical protein
MYQPIPLEFHKLSPSLENLFYGMSPQDHACYAIGTGKIDGIPTFLTFVATESFLTILVDYGAHRDDMEPFELTRDVTRLSAAKQLCFSIDWHDINSEFLKNELGFDFINYGKTATSRTPRPQKPVRKQLRNVKAEVIWLDLDIDEATGPQVVTVDETINLAIQAVGIGPDCFFYQTWWKDRQCLVYANSWGMSDSDLQNLIQRWINEGGVV